MARGSITGGNGEKPSFTSFARDCKWGSLNDLAVDETYNVHNQPTKIKFVSPSKKQRFFVFFSRIVTVAAIYNTTESRQYYELDLSISLKYQYRKKTTPESLCFQKLAAMFSENIFTDIKFIFRI